ncbi:MAG: MATE family efflux transporter [Cyanobacteria bacterium SIG30]|nr:MATE family efflux transporter [Cyanobacteria bacterium SIG30]
MLIENFKKYYKNLIAISIPIILGNISHILIGTVDVLVASRHSVDTLASISIANSIVACLFIVGIGLMAGITPVISNYLGASKPSKKYFLSTINYSLLLSTILCLITLLVIPFIGKFGFEEKLIPAIKEYIFVVAFSYFGAYLHFCLKEFLQAYEIVKFPNLVSFLAVFLNLVFNIIFVFGFWFIPAFGSVGLAIATLLVRTIMGLILLSYCLKSFELNIKLDLPYIKQLIKVGCPIAIALLLEFCAFNGITIVVARESGLFAAVQSIIISITSLTFTVPLAISNAIAIKVGFANGARNYLDLKKYSISGTVITTLFMSICAVILFFLPKQILSLFTVDEKLLNIGVPIILVASIFQIFDGMQVAFSGILKGIKKTFFVTVSILCGYWFVGLSLGAVFAYKFNMKLIGFWCGLAISIFSLSILMGITIFIMFKKLRKAYTSI